MSEKRPASDDPGASQMVVKRQKPGTSTALSRRDGGSGNSALVQSAVRTSNLEAPLMELTGHSGEIFSAKFNPTGELIASGSMDRSIRKFEHMSRLLQDIADRNSIMEIIRRV